MKNNTLKRVASLALALALVLSLAIPAFANEPDERTTALAAVDYESVVQAPTISVEITDNGAIILNPYMMAYEDPFTEKMVSAADSTSVATATNFIINSTLAPVSVAVTVSGKASDGSKAKLVNASAAKNTSAEKEVFLQFAMQGANVTDPEDFTKTELTWNTAGGTSGWKGTTAANWGKKIEVAKNSNKAELITVGTEPVKKGFDATYYIMAANTIDEKEEEHPSYAAFKLVGDMSTQSTTPWTEDDGVNVTVAFTFTIVNPTTLT